MPACLLLPWSSLATALLLAWLFGIAFLHPDGMGACGECNAGKAQVVTTPMVI